MSAPPIREPWKTDEAGKLVSLPWILWLQKVASNTEDIVLKSADGHYWRVTMSDAGAFVTSDLGTVSP